MRFQSAARSLCIGLVSLACARALGQCPQPRWESMGDLPGVNGPIQTGVEWDPDGPGPLPSVLVVGGEFSAAGSVRAGSLAVWDGASWSAMRGSAHAVDHKGPWVSALGVVNGELLACGDDMIGPSGQLSSGIVRWSGEGWVPLGGLAGFTLDLLPLRGGVAAAGTFSMSGDGLTRAMWWDGAAWTQLGLISNGADPGWLLQSAVFEGDLIVAGAFDSIDGTPVQSLARLVGARWTDMGLPAGTICRSVCVHQGQLYIITQPDTNSYDWSVLRRDGDAWTDITLLPQYFLPQGLWSANGQLFASGTGRTGGYGLGFLDSGVTRWNGAAWEPVGSDIENVQTLFPFRDRVIGAGLIVGCDGSAAMSAASWDGARWSALGQGISFDIQGLVPFRGELLAYGWLRTTQGAGGTGLLVNRNNAWERYLPFDVNGAVVAYQNDLVMVGVPGHRELVRYDGATVQDIGPPGVWAEQPVVIDGVLYCIGWNMNGGGEVVARLDDSGWVRLGRSFVDGSIDTLLGVGGQVFASGIFFAVGDENTSGLVVWDGQRWSSVPGGDAQYGFWQTEVSCAAEFQGQLLLGGYFREYPSFDEYHLARWDGQTLERVDAPVNAERMLVVGGELIVAGPHELVAWNGRTWRSLGAVEPNGLQLWSVVSDMIVRDGQLVVAGDFSSLGGVLANLIARAPLTPCCGSPDFDADGTPGTDADIQAFFACLAGNCCAACGSADFNYDGDVATDADIEAFFRVLAGGAC